MIVDAPMGATAAVLGSGVTQSTSGGSPTLAGTTNSIKNNIELNAQSGDATVAGNTSAGNATSGNATASANVLNISMSSFSLTDWFGVLFINVFGSWYGSFGINTENGTIIPLDIPDALPNSAMQPVKTPTSPAIRFGFTPKGAATSNAPFTGGVAHKNQGASAQLVRANTTPTGTTDEVSIEGDGLLQPNASPRNDPFSVAMTIGGSVIVGFGLLIELFRNAESMYARQVRVTSLLLSTLSRVEALEQPTAGGKIAHTLLYMASRVGVVLRPYNTQLKIAITQQEIANALGISRETANTELKKLERMNLVSHSRKSYILQLDELRAYVNGWS